MHQCNYCPHQTSRMYNLKVHKRNRHGIEQAPKVPRALTTVSAAACESKAPSPNQMVVPEIRPSAGNQVHYTPPHQPNNGDLSLRDFPSREKYLAERQRCDICWKTFSRKNNLSRHRKMHFIKTPKSLHSIESSATMHMQEDKSTALDKELLEDSRDIFKIYKLLQRMKQNNGS